MNRSALDLIANYTDNSSDDEVPIGRVSVKRIFKSSDDEDLAQNKKKNCRLPTPNFITKTKVFIDDQTVHDGRIRSFPHERGNWPSFIYIPCPLTEGMEEIMEKLTKMLSNIELKPVENIHISLSKTVVLRHHWIQSFTETLRDKFTNVQKFMVILGTPKVYCNDEKTRTFLGLEIKTAYDTLSKLINYCDDCLEDFKLSKYYEDHCFHVSILWALGDCEQQLKHSLNINQEEITTIFNTFPQNNWSFVVKSISCNIGNKQYSFPLL